MAEAEVGLRASLKDRVQTTRGLRQVKSEVEGVGRSAESAGARARLGARGFETMRKAGHLAGLAIKAGFVAALGVGYAMVKLLRSSFAEAREAQKVGARTNNVLKSTGGIANVTARQIGNLSTAISKKSGIDDEAIQTGENLLLTFKNIRNEAGAGNDIFNQTTKAAIDLSAAGFGSIESASKMMGKALNDPVKGLTAMGRAGVTFSASQTDQIKKMVEQNNLLGAQKIILGEVTSQVGGAAAANATWGDKAKVTFSNIEERLGKSLLPLLDDVERWFVQKGSKSLDHYLGLFEHHGIPAIKGFEDHVRPLVNKYLPLLQSEVGDAVSAIHDHLPGAASKIKATAHSVKTIADATSKLGPPIIKILDAFNKLPSWAKTAIGVGVGAGALASKLDVLGSRKVGGSGLIGMVTKAKPLPVWVVNSGVDLPGGGGKPSWIRKALGLGEKGAPLAIGGVAVAPAAALVTTAALAVAAAYGTVKYFQSGLSAPSKAAMAADQSEANRRAALTTSMQAGRDFENGKLTMANSGYDFNTLLRNQKLAHKYAFDFNTELQRTHDQLDLLGKTKVAPPFSSPGLPGVQKGMVDLNGQIAKAEGPHALTIRADARQATSVLTQLQNYTFRDKFIHVHTVQGAGNSVGTDQTAHGGTPLTGTSGRRAGTRHRTLPGYQDDRSTSTPIEIHNHLYIDGREVTRSVKQRLKAELANR